MASEIAENMQMVRITDQTLDLSPNTPAEDYIPDDILFSLKDSSKQLAPIQHQRNFTTTSKLSKKRSSNVWNHPKRRDKFRFLTEATVCVCGAGKDVSYLCDEHVLRPNSPPVDKADPSTLRAEAAKPPKKYHPLADTLVPEDYRLIKNKGVTGIEFIEDEYTTLSKDHERHLTTFPSLVPTSRFEVVKLKEAFDSMMEKIGVTEKGNESIDSVSQLHALLALVKEEQNIYNVVFHEVIRQVSVQCVERGELLARLRQRYAEMLSRIPVQIRSLHDEVLAQRALDKRLREELEAFRTTVEQLTCELEEVKKHDQMVGAKAHEAQEELRAAIAEARKNASYLNEYRSLYELQRKRLEKQSAFLLKERDFWSNAAYCLALKVTDEHELSTTRRLHASERSWAKIAMNFVVLLSDKDTEGLAAIAEAEQQWRDCVRELVAGLSGKEERSKQQLSEIEADIQRIVRIFRDRFLPDNYKRSDPDGHLLKIPDVRDAIEIHSILKKFQEKLGKESENFGGDVLLHNEDTVKKMKQCKKAWTDTGIEIFSRHREGEEESPETVNMVAMNEMVDTFVGQLVARMTGEHGSAISTIHLTNAIEIWDNKIGPMINGLRKLSEGDWLLFYGCLDDWSHMVIKISTLIGAPCPADQMDQVIDPPNAIADVRKWLTSTQNSIDSRDAYLAEQVREIHTEMIKWVIQVLLRLAPDREDASQEAREAVLTASNTIENMIANAVSLFDQLKKFTQYLKRATEEIVVAIQYDKTASYAENPDKEMNEWKKIGMEYEHWSYTAKLLLAELTEDQSHVDTPEPYGYSPSLETERSFATSSEGTAAGEKAATESAPNTRPKAAGAHKRPEGAQMLHVLGRDLNPRPQQVNRSDEYARSVQGKHRKDDIGALQLLQKQLQESEERSQRTESRCSTLQMELLASEEKIRQMTKELEAFNQAKQEEEKARKEAAEAAAARALQPPSSPRIDPKAKPKPAAPVASATSKKKK